MIAIDPNVDQSHAPIAVVDVGNHATDVAMYVKGEVSDRQRFATSEMGSISSVLQTIAGKGQDEQLAGVAIASVVPDVNDVIQKVVEDEFDLEPLFVGQQIPLPMDVLVDEPASVGVDRICAAASAFQRRKEACIVVDFGTAITLDVVDDNGAFMGGAIMPGFVMQSRCLNRQTAQLPEVDVIKPDGCIGGNTVHAIQVGIYQGVVGAVRRMVEEYSTQLGRWLPAVATGGDAKLVSEDCEIFDAIVEDLTLAGVGLAFDKRLTTGVVL